MTRDADLDADLDIRAGRLGILPDYIAPGGERRVLGADSRRLLVRLLEAGAGMDSHPAPASHSSPALEGALGTRCHLPDFLHHGRCWGLTCQIYGLASRRNWGIGDFADLARLAEIAAGAGADFLGVSPLHALYPDRPGRCSPYAPSSRRFLNILHIAPDAEPEFEDNDAWARERAALRRLPLIDHERAAALKLTALRRMHERFSTSGTDERRGAFRRFCDAGGQPLENFATFQVLSLHFAALDGAPLAWPHWPDGLHDVASPATRAFADAHRHEVGFHKWLQWLAERQLDDAQRRALAAGMRIGLYLDMAVGVAADSATAWARPELMARGAHIGAPPDPFNRDGQDWGLVPPRPNVLRAQGYGWLRDDLAASMRAAGAVRLDHAMALERLFWVPDATGMEAGTEGGYVGYRFDEMMETVARQSQAHRCLVIAEALGTLPEGFTGRLAEREAQSYQVLFFETTHDGRFKACGDYAAHALACVSTHDLPTLQGWWTGNDIGWRVMAGFLHDGEEADQVRQARRRKAGALAAALAGAGLVPHDAALPERLDDGWVEAVHRFLARSPARLVGVQIEDALGLTEQTNLPGDVAVHPNWRRKLPLDLEDLDDPGEAGLFARLASAMRQERPR